LTWLRANSIYPSEGSIPSIACGDAESNIVWLRIPVPHPTSNHLAPEGCKLFEYRDRNAEYAEVFNRAMSSYSSAQTNWVLEALDKYDFSNIRHTCDVGGGTGHLLGRLLVKYPHMKGTLLELESVISKKELLLAPKLGVTERCSYVAGDMFDSSNSQLPSSRHARLFIAEHLVPSPDKPHFSKLFDIHMMCVASGKERTVDEYSSLLEQSGWSYFQTLHPHQQSGLMEVIEGRKS
jgi:hypothetical protein